MEEFELEPGEQITKSVNRHWVILLGQIIFVVLIAFLPLLLLWLFPLLGRFSPQTAQSVTIMEGFLTQNASILAFCLGIWWIFVWMMAMTWFMTYCFTVWVITTTRIVEIHQYGFFSRRVSSFLLNRVQDVTTDIEGFFPTLFKYGTLAVETAGHDADFKMRGIANPVELRDLIMREIAALHANGQLPPGGV